MYPKSLFGDHSSGNNIYNYNQFHLIRDKSRNLSAINDKIYSDLPILKIEHIKHRILDTPQTIQKKGFYTYSKLDTECGGSD